MATTEPSPPAEAHWPTADMPEIDTVEDEQRKRKASEDGEVVGGSPKRAKQDGSEPSRPSTSPERSRRQDIAPNADHRRRESATQEEKKRSRRLFGGLLNTVSQKTASSQWQKRQEIERRQQEKLQQQKTETDHSRLERAAHLRQIRTGEQIHFDEEVMKARHAKMLSTARYLRTRTKPHLYFLPWRPTEDEEDIIDDQIRDAKHLIESELEAFQRRKGQHNQRHRRPSENSGDVPVMARGSEGPIQSSPPESKEPEPAPEPEPEPAQKKVEHHYHDPHDESGDVLVEGEEDMVIY